VKPGRFRIETHKQSATVTAVDLGFDFDGEWIESWTIQLLRLGVDEAHVAYLRTVNNPHMPRGFSWRAFSSFSEGTARKTKALSNINMYILVRTNDVVPFAVERVRGQVDRGDLFITHFAADRITAPV